MEGQIIQNRPNNNMVLAIFTTLCCCLPIGIYAIILATKVNNLYQAGQIAEAQKTADDVKKWSFIGIGVGLVCNIIYIIINFSAIMAQMQ